MNPEKEKFRMKLDIGGICMNSRKEVHETNSTHY